MGQVPLVEAIQGLRINGFQPHEDEPEVRFGQEADGLFVEIAEACVHSEVDPPLMEAPVDYALCEFASLLTSIPHARVVKDLLYAVVLDESLVLIQALFNRTDGEGQIRAVVATESALAECTVPDDACCVGSRCLKEIPVLKSRS